MIIVYFRCKFTHNPQKQKRNLHFYHAHFSHSMKTNVNRQTSSNRIDENAHTSVRKLSLVYTRKVLGRQTKSYETAHLPRCKSREGAYNYLALQRRS